MVIASPGLGNTRSTRAKIVSNNRIDIPIRVYSRPLVEEFDASLEAIQHDDIRAEDVDTDDVRGCREADK